MYKHFATPLAAALAALAIVAAAAPVQAAGAPSASSGSSTSSYTDASGQQWKQTETRGVKRTFIIDGVKEVVTGTSYVSTTTQSSGPVTSAATAAAAGCSVDYFLGDPYYSTAAGGQVRSSTSLSISTGCRFANYYSAQLRKKVGLNYQPTVDDTGSIRVAPGASSYRSLATACKGSYEYYTQGEVNGSSRLGATLRLCPA